MANKIIWLSVVAVLLCASGTSDASITDWVWPFGREKDSKKLYQKLVAQQVQYPDAPDINYNLGVLQYEQKEYEAARASFGRTLQSQELDIALRKRALFNAGKATYQQTVSMLPVGWRKPTTKIDPKICQTALPLAQLAHQYFQQMITDGFDEQLTQEHLQAAKALVDRLNQQQNKNDDKKNDKNNKNQNKDDSKDQENKEQSGDQSQQQQGDDKGNNKEQQKPYEKNKGQKGDNKDQQKSDNNQQEQQQDQQQQEQEQEEESDAGDDKDNTKDKNEGQEKEDNENQQGAGDKPQEQQAGEQPAQAAAAAEQDKAQQEDKKQKALLLDYLQHDEKALQKALLQQRTKQNTPPSAPGQKSW